MDLTFENQLIKNYFEGDNSYVPSRELIWLHEHPQVRPNFLTELEELVLDVGKIMKKYNLAGHHIEKLMDIAIRIGQRLPIITDETAPEILHAMREAYKICNDLKRAFPM